MNYEIIKIVKDNENLLQYNQYGDILKNQNKRKGGVAAHDSDPSQKRQKSTDFEDDILYCFDCDDTCIGECNSHKSQWILNKRVVCSHTSLRASEIFEDYYNENLAVTECFCKANEVKHIKTTLPYGVFLVKSQIENTTYGVWTKKSISRGTILGPFLGKLTRENSLRGGDVNPKETDVNDYIWSLEPTNNVGKNNLIDARDCMLANYLRFIRRSRKDKEQNLIPFQFDGKIFYQAFRDIGYNEELLVSYVVKTFRPPHLKDTISVRTLPSLDRHPIYKLKPTVQHSPIVEPEPIHSEEPRLTNTEIEPLRGPRTLSESPSEDPRSPVNIIDSTLPIQCNRGSHLKFDEEMKTFILELLIKYPEMTARQANTTLRRAMPHKPMVSVRSIHRIIKKKGCRPVIDVLDRDRTQILVQMIRERPDMTYRDMKKKLDALFPSKTPISYDSIEQILSMYALKNRPTANRKIDAKMYEFVANTLKKNRCIPTKDLNLALQKAFPDKPKVSHNHMSQFVRRHKLRPMENGRDLVVGERRQRVLEMYYKKYMSCREICQVLNAETPDQYPINDHSINQIVTSYVSDDSE